MYLGTDSRRGFIKTLALGAGALYAAPASSYARIIGANERLSIGVVGVNGRGLQLARVITSLGNADVAYVADVDERALARAVTAVGGAQPAAPKGVRDFRAILDDRTLDAVVIATPDHWHAPATILACSAGKHVYVEKPASHNAREGELMVAAARKYDRLVELGNQRRSWPIVIDAIAEVHGGAIGPVFYSRSTYARARDSIGQGKVAPVPSWLDYDLWQGPAPRVPYRDNVIHYNWHWFWQWGTGEAGNNGVHTIDLSRWGLGVDYPMRVAATGGHYFWDDDAETPDTQALTFEFADGKYILWEGQSANSYGFGGAGVEVSFHGREGTLAITGNGYKVFDRRNRLIREVNAQNGPKAVDRSGKELNLDGVHLDNFFQGIRQDVRLNSSIEEGHKSTLLCHLGNISHRTGRILHCDPTNGRVVNDKEAMAFWERSYAPGWEPVV